MATWLKGTVSANTHWTNHLFSLSVDTGPFPFIAGQFVRLGLSTEAGRIQRAYSLVNAPGNAQQAFLVSTVAEGKLSPLLQLLQPGDMVEVSQPASGFFILDEVPAGDNLWLMASGTGIGPFLSMLATETPYQRFAQIVLVHSVRKVDELVYQDWISRWQQRYPGQLHYVPVVTRQPDPQTLHQRIPVLIQNGLLFQACGQPLNTKSQVMLCGNPQMITDTKALLESMGLTKNLRRTPGNITVEQYW
ncbi:ferredoxin--NADP reductase [Arsukibacterium sp.]|uniref:ferredoxin--NADP reductase n=1 Tax=Arsukibacterium sp. TaxID=1977258 RepID=UPI002FD8BFF5